jgi:hypothetical protein
MWRYRIRYGPSSFIKVGKVDPITWTLIPAFGHYFLNSQPFFFSNFM